MADIIITRALPDDAEARLAYLNQIGAESDNLTFGAEGLNITTEAERELLIRQCEDGRSITLIARRNGVIVGDASLECFSRARLAHQAQLGIAVAKAEWGKGIGSFLMQAVIEHAKSVGVELISIKVRSDNARAIALYEKFGFVKMGEIPHYFKIDGNFYSIDIMCLTM